MNRPIVNIITRTHNRPEYFKACEASIKSQTYPNFQWIVGSDVPCDYYSLAIPIKEKLCIAPVPQGHYYCPWNEYLNQLAKSCVNGWCCYIDDDDYMVNNALETIVNSITSEDDLLIWKVQITPEWVVPSHSFGHAITAGDFSGIGFAFHTKHLPVDWGFFSYGDFRVAQQLLNKGLKPVWIDAILTGCQKGPHNGK